MEELSRTSERERENTPTTTISCVNLFLIFLSRFSPLVLPYTFSFSLSAFYLVCRDCATFSLSLSFFSPLTHTLSLSPPHNLFLAYIISLLFLLFLCPLSSSLALPRLSPSIFSLSPCCLKLSFSPLSMTPFSYSRLTTLVE